MHSINLIIGRLIKNSISSLARYIITVPILFIVTPFILQRLGPERFGVWAIFGVVTAYADLSDLGIASGLVRFVAMYWANNDTQAINRASSTILIVFLLMGGTMTILVILLSQPITLWGLNVPSAFADEAVVVVTGAALAFFISLIFSTYSALLKGIQRMELWNATLLVDSILNAIGAVCVLSLGYGLKALVLSRVLVSSITGLLNLWLAHRTLPSLKCRLAYFNWSTGREIVAYSLNILVSKIAIVAKDPLNKTILLWLVSLTDVTFFDLGVRLANQVRGIFSAMLVPLLPAASGIHTVGGPAVTHRLFQRSVRYIVLLVFPVFGGLAMLAGPIIEFWIGPGYNTVATTLQLILAAYFFALLATPAYVILEGVGFSKINAVNSIVFALLGVALSIILGMYFEYLGVLAGFCLSTIGAALSSIVLFHRALVIPAAQFPRAIPFRAVLIDCVAMTALGWMVTYLGHREFYVWAFIGLGYFVLCALGNLASGAFGKEDIISMRRLLFAPN